MEFLQWVELLPLSVWIRESGSIWGYSLILTLHTIGLSILVGISFALDLRLLGFAQNSPVTPYQRYFPLMWFGFWINAISGVLLLMADATVKSMNPVFWIKLALITLAMVNLLVVKNKLFRPGADEAPLPANAKFLAVTSILLWIGATTAGRLMAYIGPEAGVY